MPKLKALTLKALTLNALTLNALTLIAALCLAVGAPAVASDAKKPDCWKVPGHPDCLYPPYPGYSNSDLTAHGRKAPAVPPPAPASPHPTR